MTDAIIAILFAADLATGFEWGTVATWVILGMFLIMLVMLILLIVLMVDMSKMKKKLRIFTMGDDGRSLEEDIISIIEDNRYLKESNDDNLISIRNLNKRLESCYQKMGLVKYDAFHQMGGQLSFSLCLLDENDDGFIINSVHSAEGCYSYTKEIKGGQSALDLGDEEAEALDIAIGDH